MGQGRVLRNLRGLVATRRRLEKKLVINLSEARTGLPDKDFIHFGGRMFVLLLNSLLIFNVLMKSDPV